MHCGDHFPFISLGCPTEYQAGMYAFEYAKGQSKHIKTLKELNFVMHKMHAPLNSLPYAHRFRNSSPSLDKI